MTNIRIEIINKNTEICNKLLVDVYSIYINKKLNSKICEKIYSLFYNKVIHNYRCYSYNNKIRDIKYNFINPKADWGIEIGFLPGINDNIGNTIKQIIKEYLISNVNLDKNINIEAKSSKLILGNGKIPNKNKIEFNPITEYYKIIYKKNDKFYWKHYNNNKQKNNSLLITDNFENKNKYKNFNYKKVTNKKNKIKKENNKIVKFNDIKIRIINLNVNDLELKKISKNGINNNGTLGLSLLEMKTIKNYFSKIGRNPYDIELESLAQTWSEHCKHNIFSSPIDDIKNGLYENYIKRATKEINSNICVSSFSDNAGGIIFDENYLIVDKVETHNTPSTIDPFGGAITGILGVNRDILGFGKGAKPIMNTYYFCFARKAKNKLYRDKKCTYKVLEPKYIMNKVIQGVNVAGNCSGIPTQLGSVYFNNKFYGKVLVFVGSVGIIPRKINNIYSHIKGPKNDDLIVIVGGKVGKDGIHGATFSSKKLSENIRSTIVQIGDPIMQKKMSNAIIEARDLNLYNSITDNGAGGLSSSVGEMGKNGFEVDLSKVKLKNYDMELWEIWISESQERMTLAIPEKNLPIFEKIMKKHDVEISIIGRFNNTGKAIVKYSKKIVMDLETKFLHDGKPKIHLKSKKYQYQYNSYITSKKSRYEDYSILEIELKEMLSRPNICCKEFIVVQYDHEVQGTSVLKPIQGKGRVCSEVIISRPILDSKKGIVKSQGFGSSYGKIDIYYMAACAIDTAIRNYISAGGNINHLALLDNFCWSDSYNPRRLWQLKKASQACYDFAIEFKTPFISGKDSMFNDFKGYDKNGKKITISTPPSLLISAIGIIENIENAISIDVKFPGDLIYILGMTYEELAMSEYQLYSGIFNNNVPKVNAKNARKLYECYNIAIKNNVIASAIAVNLGGLAIALVKSLIAGDLGAEIDLSLVPTKIINSNIKNKIIMFSESQSRILVTINPKDKKKFEKIFGNIVFSCIGKTTEEKILNIKDILKSDLKDLENSYRKML